MIKGIHLTAISTGDFARSLKFYRDLLGFKVTFEFEFKPGDEVVQRLTIGNLRAPRSPWQALRTRPDSRISLARPQSQQSTLRGP